MKSFTDIKQSKKLAEILPLESADMCFANDGTAIKIDAQPYNVRKLMWKDVQLIPCWSLAALLDVLPFPDLFYNDGWNLYVTINDKIININYVDSPIDACYEMIMKLKEKNLL